jgi:hypothetical protein
MFRLLGCKPSAEILLIDPLQGHVPALPVMCDTPAPKRRSQVFDLAPICFGRPICAKVPGNGGTDGYLKCRHRDSTGQAVGKITVGDLFVPSLPYTFHNSGLRVVYTLFILYLFLLLVYLHGTNKEKERLKK